MKAAAARSGQLLTAAAIDAKHGAADGNETPLQIAIYDQLLGHASTPSERQLVRAIDKNLAAFNKQLPSSTRGDRGSPDVEKIADAVSNGSVHDLFAAAVSSAYGENSRPATVATQIAASQKNLLSNLKEKLKAAGFSESEVNTFAADVILAGSWTPALNSKFNKMVSEKSGLSKTNATEIKNIVEALFDRTPLALAGADMEAGALGKADMLVLESGMLAGQKPLSSRFGNWENNIESYAALSLIEMPENTAVAAIESQGGGRQNIRVWSTDESGTRTLENYATIMTNRNSGGASARVDVNGLNGMPPSSYTVKFRIGRFICGPQRH